jgi:hypothetical protein
MLSVGDQITAIPGVAVCTSNRHCPLAYSQHRNFPNCCEIVTLLSCYAGLQASFEWQPISQTRTATPTRNGVTGEQSDACRHRLQSTQSSGTFALAPLLWHLCSGPAMLVHAVGAEIRPSTTLTGGLVMLTLSCIHVYLVMYSVAGNHQLINLCSMIQCTGGLL